MQSSIYLTNKLTMPSNLWKPRTTYFVPSHHLTLSFKVERQKFVSSIFLSLKNLVFEFGFDVICFKSWNHILKYGFCSISERWTSDQLNTFTTYLSSLLGVIAEYNSNHAQKWGQIWCKSGQLVRGSSFRNDLLQNPYFS